MKDGNKGVVLSVRVSDEDAEELRKWSEHTGRSVSDIVREGIRYPLERQRALWLEERRGGADGWEIVGAQAGTPRKLDSVFGVRVTGEQMHALLPAAEACDMPLSRFLREAGLRMAESMARGGTAWCRHLAIGGVTGARCAKCGPMPVDYMISGRAL